MGVTLDVVYNHTASVGIFENLVPNYYHFMDADGKAKESFGGGRLGTTHEMSRKILVDSISYWTSEFKVDGFRFDMMGDHDAESIQIAFNEAKKLNPKIIMIGEGWRTYSGDDGIKATAADQDWMKQTEAVGSFSDEIRNELKSGFGSEGEPRFLTNGSRNIQQIFDNIKGQPHNFDADQPGDVVQYIAAHDNLTLYDVIAQSIKKDPDVAENNLEIHKRIRIGNSMVLTAQGTAFIHAGQEYGRTKQWREETTSAPIKSTYMLDNEGKPFIFPYFIHDSNDSSDIINRFDWDKATNSELYPINNITREYTTGLIELRKSTDAFRLGTKALVDTNVTLVNAVEIKENDLVIAYRNEATNGDAYYVFVNADDEERTLSLDVDLTDEMILVDNDEAGTTAVSEVSGVDLKANNITIDPLTTIVIKETTVTEEPIDSSVALENATKAVEKAEASKTQTDVAAAIVFVNTLPDSDIKISLMGRLNKVQNTIDNADALEEARKAVEKAEASKVQADVDAANVLVKYLEDEAMKTELMNRINELPKTGGPIMIFDMLALGALLFVVGATLVKRKKEVL
jgi:pullulanase